MAASRPGDRVFEGLRGFVERRWTKLAPIADLGALRAREVLLGERHPECDLAARGPAPTAYISAVRSRWRQYFS